MRLLIFGVSGMLGHKLYQVAKEEGHVTYGSMRQGREAFLRFGIFDDKDILDHIDVRVESDVQHAIAKTKPELVVNCAGIIKSLAKDELDTITVNSIFPHRLGRICALARSKLIQVSTDCVFSGAQGHYSEDSIPDPVDLYGRTKLLGEVTYNNHLTVRTSMIGRELGTRRNLIEWFLSQSGEVRGFTRAIFSGLATRALSRVILDLGSRDVGGLIHVASEPICKYELLRQVKDALGLANIFITPVPGEVTDRSLTAQRLTQLGIKVPTMPEMVRELASENTMYERVK
jgi:dTDP-4-dehydrorhamnose reductase